MSPINEMSTFCRACLSACDISNTATMHSVIRTDNGGREVILDILMKITQLKEFHSISTWNRICSSCVKQLSHTLHFIEQVKRSEANVQCYFVKPYTNTSATKYKPSDLETEFILPVDLAMMEECENGGILHSKFTDILDPKHLNDFLQNKCNINLVPLNRSPASLPQPQISAVYSLSKEEVANLSSDGCGKAENELIAECQIKLEPVEECSDIEEDESLIKKYEKDYNCSYRNIKQESLNEKLCIEDRMLEIENRDLGLQANIDLDVEFESKGDSCCSDLEKDSEEVHIQNNSEMHNEQCEDTLSAVDEVDEDENYKDYEYLESEEDDKAGLLGAHILKKILQVCNIKRKADPLRIDNFSEKRAKLHHSKAKKSNTCRPLQPRDLLCAVCNKTFYSKFSLWRHSKNHKVPKRKRSKEQKEEIKKAERERRKMEALTVAGSLSHAKIKLEDNVAQQKKALPSEPVRKNNKGTHNLKKSKPNSEAISKGSLNAKEKMDQTELQCKHCVRTFSSNFRLWSHCKQKHPDPQKKNKKCLLCSMSFSSTYILKKHVMLSHSYGH